MSSSPVSIIVAQDRPSVQVQCEPQVIFVQYRARTGARGADGVTPDLTDPGVIEEIMEGLTAQITASQLHQSLLTRINKIDLGANSLESQADLLAYAQEQLNLSLGTVANRLTEAEGSISDIDSQLITLGSDLSTLDGTVSGNAAIVDLLETRVTVSENNIQSQAISVEGLGARVDVAELNVAGQAGIVNTLVADVSYIDGQLTAVSSSVSTLSSQVGSNTSAIQTNATAIATLDGEVSAEYTVKLNVNNKIAGFGLFASNAEPSLFEVVADRFAITNQDNTGVIPFIVDGNNVYIKSAFIADASITSAKIGNAQIKTANIENAAITNAKIASLDVSKLYAGTAKIATALIGDAQVQTLQIAGNAVTVPLETALSSVVYGNGSFSNVMVLYVPLAVSGKIMAIAALDQDYSNAQYTHAKLWINGEVVYEVKNWAGGRVVVKNPVLAAARTCPAGTITVFVEWAGENASVWLSRGSLVVMGVQR